MQKIEASLAAPQQQNCTIYIGSGAIEEIGTLLDLSQYSRVVIVTDQAMPPALLERLSAALSVTTESVVLPSGESQKSISSIQTIWTALHKAGCDRQSLVVNLGGGVIGDVGGFAAATYMRGLDFLNLPTTLLSQVDSSVGGKTGFNFDGIKNLVGSFSQPVAVVIDPTTLATLPKREFVAGFGEIIKHGLVWDNHYFEQVTAKRPADYSPEELEDIIAGSCRIKVAIIEDDVHEGGTRKLVNFGHTVGHAVESLSLDTASPLLHGEAVSIGMVAEATISHSKGLLASEELQRITSALQNAGLPVTIPGLSIENIFEKMRSDKKNNDSKLQFTLLDRIGHAIYNQEVPVATVTEAVQAILN